MQLERILQSQGFGSRKTCRRLIEDGEVSIAGVPCRDPRADFAAAGFAFEIDGETWHYAEKIYLALHKPAGFECSRTPRHHAGVYELLPLPFVQRGVQSVGRLDADTTGLLLFSDDGQFIHAMTSPRRHVIKHYRAVLKHVFDDSLIDRLLTGVQLLDEPVPLAALAAHRLDAQTLSLSVDQGKYHQIKRMVAAAGNRVETLHRHGFGALSLASATPPGNALPLPAAGDWCLLDEKHLAALDYRCPASLSSHAGDAP